MYVGQEATARSEHGTTDWFQIRKGVRQGCILSPRLFNLYAEYIMRNAELDEAQAGVKIDLVALEISIFLIGEIPITSDMQMTPLLWEKAEKN